MPERTGCFKLREKNTQQIKKDGYSSPEGAALDLLRALFCMKGKFTKHPHHTKDNP
jgi:hypothetical protein